MKHYLPEINRNKRQGFPEAIFCPGKTINQIIDISKDLIKGYGPVIATKSDKNIFVSIKKIFPLSKYYEICKIIHIKDKKTKNIQKPKTKNYVCIVTAGTSDIPVAEEAAVVCEILGGKVERIYDVGVSGIHRLFKYQDKLIGATCVVVCAGMEGALASVVGGIVRCHVIGVPTSVGYGVSFKGVSALLTMLNSCAANVSVVNIDDGFGAGIIANLTLRSRDR